MDILAVLQLVSTMLVLVVFSWTVRVQAELRDQLRRLGEGQRRLSARIGRIITVEALQNAQRCVFALSLEDRHDWRVDGVGVVCVSEGNAVTAAHNLTAAKAAPGARVYGEVYVDGAATRLQLEVVRVNKQLDVATLRVVTPSAYPHFLECCESLPADVPGGTTLALCAFQTAEEEHAGARARVWLLHGRHARHRCAREPARVAPLIRVHDVCGRLWRRSSDLRRTVGGHTPGICERAAREPGPQG